MEGLAISLFYITLIGIIASIGLMIYSVIKKEFKYRPKKLSIVLGIFIVAFIGSTVFYGSVQSPESKAKFVANEKAKAEEKAQKELSETEKKAEAEKLKQEDQEVKENSEATTESEKKEDVPVVTEVKEEAPKADNRFVITSEINTSAAVDELYYKANEKATTATEDDLKEAIKFINDNYNNYWADNETMHKTMYYGSLLQCANKDKAKEDKTSINYTFYNLGTDTVQVVKYVYRKAEKVEDSSTQSNLKQIKKSLDKIPDNYKK